MGKVEMAIIRVVAWVLVFLIAWLGVKYVLDLRDENKEVNARLEQQDKTNVATGQIGEAATTAQAGQAAATQRVIETRIEYRTLYEQAKSEDAAVGAFDGYAVPARLRNLACQRRISRTGSGNPQVECQYVDRTSGTGG